jgi:hypothetical protein
VAAALAHAHRRGVTHRDIKPENLMFADDGAIKVADFGLAQLAHASHLTRDGTTLGTAAYMAPESAHGHSDARADVFALGVVLYELLGGRLPFHADTPLAMLYAIANSEPHPLRERRPDLPPEVESLVMSLLTRSPEQRPSCNAAAVRLSEMTGVPYASQDGGVGESGRVSADSGAITINVRHSEMPAPSQPSPGPRRRISWRAWAGVAASVLLLGWAGYRRLRPAGTAGDRPVPAAQALQARTLAELDSAQARASEALRIDATNASARINLAQVLRLRGEPTRAASLFSEVTRSSAADRGLRAVAWDALGDMAMEDRTWPEAVRALEQGFALDSTERAYSQLGYALVRAARPSDALLLLRRGVAAFPGSAALHKNTGYALLQLDSLAAARLEVDRAITLDPGFGPALGLRARLEARAGEQRAAARDWRAFLDSHPGASDSAEVAADLSRLAVIR